MKTAKRITNSKSKILLIISYGLVVVRTLEEIIKEACILSKKTKPLLCKQAINTFGEVVVHSLSVKIFNPERACARLRLCPKTWENEILGDYIQGVLKDKPNTPQPTPTKRNTYKMMHISDLHVDLEYQVVRRTLTILNNRDQMPNVTTSNVAEMPPEKPLTQLPLLNGGELLLMVVTFLL